MRALHSIWSLLSVAACLVTAQDFSTVPPCGQTCFNNIKSTATVTGTLGCDGADQVCLCGKVDYRNGLHDCVVQGCPGDTTALNALNVYVDSLCSAVATSVQPLPSASTSAPPPPPPRPATTTAAPTTTSVSTAASVPSTTSSSSSFATSTTSAPTVATTASSSTSTGAVVLMPTESRSTSQITSSSASSSTAAAAGASSSDNEGLSYTTKVGIGLGGAAAAVGLMGVAVCILIHKRGNRRGSGIRSLSISEPMPGSGRSYAGDHHTQKYSVGMAELDFKSRRYEDMLPRQSPRNMV